MKKISLLMAAIGLLLIGSFVLYEVLDAPVDKTSKASVEVVIEKGMSTSSIAQKLKKKKLIKNEFFFKLVTKLNRKTLKASTYSLKKNMSTTKIVKELSKKSSYDPNVVNVTFKDGQSYTSYAQTVATYTNNSYEDFINQGKDQVYLNELINKYWFLTDEILNPNIYYPLEGYLMPDTYQFKNKDVSSKEIIETLLNQTKKVLDKNAKSIEKSNFSVHQIITLASIAQLEANSIEDMGLVIGVFFNRLESKISLGSDVTTYYALQKEMTADLTAAELNTENPYNTRTKSMAGKLPVGPICNPKEEALDAAINPTDSDYLFFVADKNGKIYYTKTMKEHEKKIQEIKQNGDWIW